MAWTLHEGDCLEIMRTMPDESVDAVITDPPYGINYQSARRTDKTQRLAKISNDKRPFVWWLWDAYRLVKEGGAMVCFCRWDTEEVFKNAIGWAGFSVKSQVIWDREDHGMGDLKAAFAPQHDIIWFATKGNFEFSGKRPYSVIRSRRLAAEKLIHPNEKPVDLLVSLITSVVPRGGMLLDPMAGSGTSGVAAERCGRNSVMIEKDPKHCTAIRKRMIEAEKGGEQLTLFDACDA